MLCRVKGRLRWWIGGLLFASTVINYLDRQTLSVLGPLLKEEFTWSNQDFALIIIAFRVAYAVMQTVAGRVLDRIGTRNGLTVSVLWYSTVAVLTSLASGLWSFCGFRFLLGAGEAANWPGATKAVSEWFPRRERALATGIFNAGSNVGAIVAPLLVPWITLHYGWRAAFIATGAIGLVWLAFWWPLYGSPEHHPRVSPGELAHIKSEPDEPGVRLRWRDLVTHRQTWAFAVAKFMTDPIWWLYLYWVPDFLNRNHGIDLQHIGPPLVTIYLVADVGSIGGGWLSSWLLEHGWTVNAARKTAMLTCALAVVPIVLASRVSGLWTAVAIVSLAAAAHQGWSANVFTMASDMFPRWALGTVVGFGGMAGAIGGMFIAKITGFLLETTGSYLVVFGIAGSAYLVALAIVHLLVPRLEPARLSPAVAAANGRP